MGVKLLKINVPKIYAPKQTSISLISTREYLVTPMNDENRMLMLCMNEIVYFI